MQQETQTFDEAKLHAFMGKVVEDLAATFSSAMVLIGDKLGLYKAMAGAGPLTSVELAQRTATTERYVREWLLNQAAGGYLEYDPQTGRYRLPDEHALALADEHSPVFVQGGFQNALAMLKAEPRIAEAFRTGEGMPWGEHDSGLFLGTERFFGTLYAANLVSIWIPALHRVRAKLEAGATVADIGCGHGTSTILLAQAFPRSRFFGYDNHAPSIQHARQAAAEAGVTDRVTFESAAATEYPRQGLGYDLIAFFDCFHDLGTPIEAATHAAATLAKEGTVLLVEPMAGEHIEDNLNPVGRLFSAGSILCCTPNALASGGMALGNQATDQQLREAWHAGGLSSFRRAITTPFNRVFEVQAERFYPL
jgi:SAM-dependent methyltransferase